jgi:hypothetical protein
MAGTKQYTSRAAALAAIMASASASTRNMVMRLGGKLKKARRWTEPHQGKRECARRRRQMASGMLPQGAPTSKEV